MGLFGTSKKDPKEMVREWRSKLRKEERQLDRQILGIQREEEKVKRSLKDAAKKGDKASCQVLAKEMLRARKAVNKIYSTKAQLKSVEHSMEQQIATLRMSGALQKSTEVMKSMEKLVKIPELQATMREMSKEMMKMGIIEEMMEDMFTETDDVEEEEAQEAIDKVIWEITSGELGKMPAAVRDSLPVADDEEEPATVDDDVTEMQARLESLRS